MNGAEMWALADCLERRRQAAKRAAAWARWIRAAALRGEGE
jgi:hypothetical protein